MHDINTHHPGCCSHAAAAGSCHGTGHHHGYMSKKMQIQELEKHLEQMKTHTLDLEEYIRELKEN